MSKLAALSIVAIAVKLNVERVAERVSAMIRSRQCPWLSSAQIPESSEADK